MTLWLILTILMACAVGFAALPFLRKARGIADTPAIGLLKRQLSELERDLAAGEIDTDAAASARTEIERRLLEEASKAPSAATPAPQMPNAYAAIAVAAIVAFGSAGLYAVIGEPDAASAAKTWTSANQTAEPAHEQQSLADVDTMIARLAARLQAQPADAEGWRMLGWSYYQTQRYTESAKAFAKAIALAPRSADYQSSYGEALMMEAGGIVTKDALAAFECARGIDPKDVRARFYKGLAKSQKGNAKAALDEWILLLKDAEPGSAWADELRERITALAAQSRVDVSKRLPKAEAQNTKPSMPPAGDQAAIVTSMVEGLSARLERDPNDAEGWLMLIRSRIVLGQQDLAKEALRRALSTFSAQPDTREAVLKQAKALGVAL